MKIKQLLPFLFMAVLFASCSQVYSPALYHQDIAYQPKPTSFDTVKSLTYVSAGLNNYASNNFNDLLTSGQINLSRGHVFNNFNLAYGAFGVFGDYQSGTGQTTDPTSFKDKFFGAYGARVSANLFANTGRVDFRYLGMEAVYSHEFGAYADFRKYFASQSGTFVDPRTDLLTVGLTSEVIFHNINNNNFQHGIRVFLGTTLGHNALYDTYYSDATPTGMLLLHLFPKASYFISFKRYFATLEAGEEIFLRFGYKF